MVVELVCEVKGEKDVEGVGDEVGRVDGGGTIVDRRVGTEGME